MSLTNYLKIKLGITEKEATLLEKEVKNFTNSIKESYSKKENKNKIKESKKRFFKEEDETPEIPSDVEDVNIDDISEEDISDMSSDMEDASGLVGDKYPDNEVEMVKVQLKSIISNAENLMNTLDHEQNLDAWIQSKITLAQDYLNSAHDYILYSDTYTEEPSMEEISEELAIEDIENVEEPSMEEPVVEKPVAEETPVEEAGMKESFKYGFISF